MTKHEDCAKEKDTKFFAVKIMTIAAIAGLTLNSGAGAENITGAAAPAPTLGENSAYAITKGSANDYTYQTINADGSKNYWKINLKTEKMSTSDSVIYTPNATATEPVPTSWNETTKKATGTIGVTLPHNDGTATQYYDYTYAKPSNYNEHDAINNQNTVLGDINNYVFAKLNSSEDNYNQGGAITNNSSAEIGDIIADFIVDTAYYSGGAIHNDNSKIGNINGSFIGDHTTNNNSLSYGGAIYNTNSGIIGNITGNFIDNLALRDSAIYNYNSKIGNITGNFIGNQTFNLPSFSGGSTISNGNNGSIENITGNFIGNYNGAHVLYNEHGSTIGTIKGDFIGNISTVGQGVVITNDGNISNIEGDFIGNHSTRDNDNYLAGGAIKNEGVIEHIKGNFINNYLTTSSGDLAGGALSNNSGYSGSIGTITGNFISNYIDVENGFARGGAINNETSISQISGDFIGNYVHGTQADGGAIVNNFGSDINTINGNFRGNYAQGNVARGGAIFSGGENINITGDFINNYVEGTTAYGGAIYNSGLPADTVPIDTVATMVGAASFDQLAQMFGYENGDAMLAVWNKNSREEFTWTESYAIIAGVHSVDELYEAMGMTEEEIMAEIMAAAEEQGITINSIDDYWKFALTAEQYPTGKLTFAGKSVLSNNYANGELNDIYNDGEIYLAKNADVTSNSGINGSGVGSIKLAPGSKLNINHYLDKQNVTLDDATINLGSHLQQDGKTTYGTMNLEGLNVTANGGNLNAINNHVFAHNLGNVNLAGNLNYTADVDLKNAKMDSLDAASVTGNGKIVVQGLNLISDSDKEKTDVYFTTTLKNNVDNKVTKIGKGINNNYQKTAYSPIYKYDVRYDNRNDAGYFVFDRSAGSSSNNGNQSDSFNPAVLSSPVTAQAASVSTMTQVFADVFDHADIFMNQPEINRFAEINSNSYALKEDSQGISTDYNENQGNIDYANSNKSVWVKPYVTFESINLKNGPKVDVQTYGSLIGFDSNIKKLRKGWSNVASAYIGYNGNHIHYTNVDTTTNGGILGLTETFYKGNFWTALTASVGASNAESDTMYGRENSTSLLTGVASKTGYNFEFKNGRFIVQPRIMLAYSMVKTFDYTNAAGVRINSDPMHNIQIAPALKFIANTKNGWQPYASVGMNWNLLNENSTYANNIKLPRMSTKPYVEYGVGIQKNWKDKYSGYGQAMIRNGGRTGIALTFGFRMALGSDPAKHKEKVQKTDNKKISNTKILKQSKTNI